MSNVLAMLLGAAISVQSVSALDTATKEDLSKHSRNIFPSLAGRADRHCLRAEECAAVEMEKALLQKFSKSVIRDNDRLEIRTSSGKVVVVADDEDTYTFSDYLESIGCFLITAWLPPHESESKLLTLIHDKTGVVYSVPSQPVISPDGKWFVVTSCEKSDGSIGIWKVDATGLKRSWFLEPKWCPVQSEWDGSRKIRIAVAGSESPVQLELGRTEWTLKK